MNKIDIRNRKAEHSYELSERFTAGLLLMGTEIKSIRLGKASLADSFCVLKNNELYVKMHISEYDLRGYVNHEAKRDRKLLLNRQEINRLARKSETKGFTIIPLRLFISDTGYAKLEIALARGKQSFDKRHDIKDKDNKRELDRAMKRDT